MNQKTFEELVKDSRLLNKDTLSELEQVLKEYPFCQTFHLLYTKNLYLEKHIRYNQQLKIAAAIVGDRSRLKHYLEDSDTTINSAPEQLATPPDSIVDQDSDYESIVLSTLDAKISREEKKKAIIALINKKFLERIDLKVENKSKLSVMTPEQVITLEAKPESSTDSHELVESVCGNEDLKSSMEEELSSSDESDVTSSEVLIERFLRDAPRLSRPKKEFYNPVNLAARSIEENEDFYTETYASICLKQGNVAKALKIYAKLSLKLPEKSSYFAGLIEKIKQENNI